LTEVLRPQKLREGDVVALVAPAGPLASADELRRAEEVVRSLGLVPLAMPRSSLQLGYLAGTDEQRAADFNEAARDPEVRAIFALRGGYGTMRILDRIDYDAIRRDPKVILGYSDLTALLNVITQRTGVLTFHGPVAALSEFTPNEVAWLRAAVMSAAPLGTLHVPQARALCGGVSQGRLAGGNLSLITALLGTPHEIDVSQAVLVIEEVDEAPYRIDRMLTQLRLNGVLERVAGIVAGGFTNCDVTEDHRYAGLRLERVLEDRLGELHVPVLLGLPIGHIDEQWTLPLGATVLLDAGARTLTITESAVQENVVKA
jgi:muramoyltetrapeptide carboxypeptidase